MWIGHIAALSLAVLATAARATPRARRATLEMREWHSVTQQAVTTLDTSGDLFLASDEIGITINGLTQVFTRDPFPDAREGQILGQPSWSGLSGNSSLTFIKFEGIAGELVYGSLVDVEAAVVYQIGGVAHDGNTRVTVKANADFAPEAHSLEPHVTEDIGADEGSGEGADEFLADDGTVLDILVVWTRKAECARSGFGLNGDCAVTQSTEDNMRALIALANVETNDAFAASGINLVVNLVHAYRDGDYVEASFGDTLNDARYDRGLLSGLHAKRTQYAADAVILIIADSQYCGIAYKGPSKALMFSVTAHNCATGYYSYAHELAHNMGADHDRGTASVCSRGGYGFGYRDINANFRSVMAYNCRTDPCFPAARGSSCARVKMFSTGNLRYNGNIIGSATEDNALQISSKKLEVSRYYDSSTRPPPPAPSTKPTPAPLAPILVPTPAPTPPPTKPPIGPPTRLDYCPEGYGDYGVRWNYGLGRVTIVHSHEACAARCSQYSDPQFMGGCKAFMTGMYYGFLYCRSYGGNLRTENCASWAVPTNPGLSSGELGFFNRRTGTTNIGGHCCSNTTFVEQAVTTSL